MYGKRCGKEENAADQHFLLFPQRFLPLQKINSIKQVENNLSFTEVFKMEKYSFISWERFRA